MAIDGPPAAAGVSAARIAIIAALKAERVALERAGEFPAALTVRQSGPGPERAALAASAVLADGATALVSWGLAGGLVPGLLPGTVVVPRRIVAEGAEHTVDAGWAAAVTAALSADLAVQRVDIVSTRSPLATPADKARAAAVSGAGAVDMESAAIAAEASRGGAAFVAIRVVVDASDDALPGNAERWLDANGDPRAGAAVGALFRPRDWPALLVMARRYAIARRALERTAARLVPAAFCRPRAH